MKGLSQLLLKCIPLVSHYNPSISSGIPIVKIIWRPSAVLRFMQLPVQMLPLLQQNTHRGPVLPVCIINVQWCAYIHGYIYIYVYIYIHVYIHIYTHVSSIYSFIYIYTYVYIYTYIYIYIHTYMLYIYICIHVIYVIIYIYIHVIYVIIYIYVISHKTLHILSLRLGRPSSAWCIATRLSCATSRPTCGLFPFQRWTSLSTTRKTWNLHVSWGYNKNIWGVLSGTLVGDTFSNTSKISENYLGVSLTMGKIEIWLSLQVHWSLGWSFMGLQVREHWMPHKGPEDGPSHSVRLPAKPEGLS